jgi:NAD(P)-dependent dehydrogenase (short-subunit alcohol dehydrogenase family)
MNGSKTAIVTAAGRGIGAGVARMLARDGFFTVLMSPSGCAPLAQQLGGVGLAGSVARADDLQRLVDLAMETTGRIDAVFNGTGHPPKGPLLEISDADWLVGVDMVLLNVIRMARLVTPIMRAQGGGSIVNLSSYAAYEPESDFPLSTLRASLGALTKLYADEQAVHGIRMNCVLPGFVDSLPEKATRRQRIPLQRYARVEEIAEAVAFLLSDKASYITGQNLRVDGGITRSV